MQKTGNFVARPLQSGTLSLSLRFGFTAIGILALSIVAVSYLYEHFLSNRDEANRREYLRLHAERAADQLRDQALRLVNDTLFLARTPPLERLRGISQQSMQSGGSEESLEQLEALFISLAYARPWYFQVRLIGMGNDRRELVRIERRGAEVVAVPRQALQPKGHRYYVQEAESLSEGQVKLSRIDLNREHGEITPSETVTLRAITPVRAPGGRLIALVVINLEMQPVFESMTHLVPVSNRLFLANQEGNFLYHPDPGKAMGFDHGRPYGMRQEFPIAAAGIGQIEPGSGRYFQAGPEGASLPAYVTTRSLNENRLDTRLVTLVLVDAPSGGLHDISAARRDSYLAVTSLVCLAALLIALITHALTRSLRDLVRVSEQVTRGDYGVAVPHSSIRDVDQLNRAFEHMITALQDREARLQELNRTLEQRVSQRTGELEASRAALVREQGILQSVVDHIADGVVAVDSEGHFLLWNRRAEAIVGMGPSEVPMSEWSEHYGIFRSPAGEPVPPQEVPLVRALAGETVRGLELFVRNARNMPGHWISVDARPVTDASDNPQGAVAVMVNIDDARRLREMREARSGELSRIGRLALIGQIVDTTAHSLSQPLAAIANYAAAAALRLASGNLDREQLEEILGHISRQAERGGVTLNALRKLTRSDGLTVERLDLNSVVQSALELLSDRLQRQHVRIERRLSPKLPLVDGQEMELQQALIHLIINAMEALADVADDQRRLYVSSDFRPTDDRILIRLEHAGPARKAGLSEPPAGFLGTMESGPPGLGLAVVRNILDQHNGTVAIECRNDGLIRYLIELPASRTANG